MKTKEKTTISQTILAMAAERGPEKSVCPSEIARELFPEDWRARMQDIRNVAADLHKSGKVLITQQDQPADPDHLKGPVRIKIVL